MPGMKAFFTKEAGDSALSEVCRAALSDFTSSADNTFTGIIQTVTSKLNLWINPIVDRATAESDFSLTDLRRSEEHTSELQSLLRISYAVFCLKTNNKYKDLYK